MFSLMDLESKGGSFFVYCTSLQRAAARACTCILSMLVSTMFQVQQPIAVAGEYKSTLVEPRIDPH